MSGVWSFLAHKYQAAGSKFQAINHAHPRALNLKPIIQPSAFIYFNRLCEQDIAQGGSRPTSILYSVSMANNRYCCLVVALAIEKVLIIFARFSNTAPGQLATSKTFLCEFRATESDKLEAQFEIQAI